MISVIVPVYNIKKYIKPCVESILNQTYDDLEIILVDDGSDDGSGAVCDRFKEKEQKITVLHQENKGLSEARNAGMKAARGEYLAFIDGDDFIHPQYFEILWNNLIKNHAAVSVCNFTYAANYKEVRKIRDRKKMPAILLSGIDAVKEIVKNNETYMIIACGKLYEKKLFDSIRFPKGKVNEDEFVTYKILYHAKRVAVTKEKLYYYRKREDSIMGNHYSLKRLDKLTALKEATAYFHEEELKNAAKLRYLLNLQIAYFRLETELPECIREKKALIKEHKRFYQQNKKELTGCANNIDKITITVFLIHPKLYKGFAALYLLLQERKDNI